MDELEKWYAWAKADQIGLKPVGKEQGPHRDQDGKRKPVPSHNHAFKEID